MLSMKPLPLPTLDIPEELNFTLVPINGHQDEHATRLLRTLSESHNCLNVPYASLTKHLRHIAGKFVQCSKATHTLILFTFSDNTALLGIQINQGLGIKLYPQPLFMAGPNHAHVAFKKLTADSAQNLVDGVLACAPMAMTREAILLPHHHWPTWSDIAVSKNLAQVQDLIRPLASLLSLFPMPAKLPPPRYSAKPNALPLVTVLVKGRKWSLQGAGNLTVDLSPDITQLNPAWSEDVRATLWRYFSHPDMFPALSQVSQSFNRNTMNGTGISANTLYNLNIPLGIEMSAHDKLVVAATLPEGILA